MDRRNEAFQQLKPVCVALGQSAIGLQRSQTSSQSVATQLERLKNCLTNRTGEPYPLDAQLAEYVFFPIAQVLKASQKASIRCLELCLQCIAILVEHGWSQQLSPQLAAQVVILCTLLGDRTPKGLAFAESTDELQLSAFSCLDYVFNIAGTSKDVQSTLCSDSNFPQLGQTVSILLDGIHLGRSVETQVTATAALKELTTNVMDREIQATFLPGIVSKLTKVLTPETKGRRSYKVLIECLGILRTLLRTTLRLDDNQPDKNRESLSPSARRESVVNPEWRTQAATQLKPALIKVMRLRNHSRPDVKEALAEVCLTLLESCRPTLANCSSNAVETIVVIIAADSVVPVATELEVVINSDSSIAILLQGLISDWLQSLTTTMQGADEHAKSEKLENIRTAYGLLRTSGKVDTTLDLRLAIALRDSIVVTLTAGRVQRTASAGSAVEPLDLTVIDTRKGINTPASSLAKYKGQGETMQRIEALMQQVCTAENALNLSVELLRSLHHSEDLAQIANFWLLLQVIEIALHHHDAENELLHMESEERANYNEVSEELYAFSLALLTRPSEETSDTRLQVLALRSLSLRARTAGKEFRYELVDALYPVLNTLAMPDEQLQQESIKTLDILASACGYSSVRELIVQNVDYLTNSVALKLNAFDISPQAPQILLMMVRLAGPSLLPYLEDTVHSIFAALEDYHGYPMLVELLFKVLNVVAEEGVKAPKLSITNNSAPISTSLGTEQWQPSTISGLAALLKEHALEERDHGKRGDDDLESAPQRPWKGIDELSKAENDASEEEAEPQDQQLDDTEAGPPAPRTYNLLFKIAESTQHFLPSASPALRHSLLALIRTTIPAIARHENTFLPLINTLWPEVVSRIDDQEPYIIATALDVVHALCQHAGDFMRTRIVHLWPRLVEIYSRNVVDLAHPTTGQDQPNRDSNEAKAAGILGRRNDNHAIIQMQERAANQVDTASRLVYEALTTTLVGIVQHIRISPEAFDEALGMLEAFIEDAAVAVAFETENADAYWLARFKNGTTATPVRPISGNELGWQFTKVPV